MTIYSTAKHYFQLCALAFVLTALLGLAVHAGHNSPSSHPRVQSVAGHNTHN